VILAIVVKQIQVAAVQGFVLVVFEEGSVNKKHRKAENLCLRPEA
jgi:hypothetical protein